MRTSARSLACHWGNCACQQGMPSTPCQVDSEGVPRTWKILKSCPICAARDTKYQILSQRNASPVMSLLHRLCTGLQ